jgi:Tfp pilus assembly protein PilO
MLFGGVGMMQPATGKPGGVLGIDAAGVGVCALISLLGYAAIVGPVLQQRSLAAEQQQKIHLQQQKAEEMRNALTLVQRQMTTVQEELAAGTIQLDSAAQINRRMAALTEFFAECGLHIDDVQTERTYSGLQCDLVPITIVGRGGYVQCVRFLHRLCSVFPDMSVTQIEIRGTGHPGPGSTPSMGDVSPAGVRTAWAGSSTAQQFRFGLFWYTAPTSKK